MKRSILRNLYVSMASFGLLMGIIFPFYAAIFVDFKDGMLTYFVIGALMAGVTVGAANIIMLRLILIKEVKKIDILSNALKSGNLSTKIDIESDDEIGRIISNINDSISIIFNLIKHVSKNSDNLSSTSITLEEFSSKLSNLFKDSVETSKTVHWAINKLEQSSNEISRKIEKLDDNSSIIQNSIEDLRGTILSIIDHSKVDSVKIDMLNREFLKMIDIVELLSNSSKSVSKVVASIQDISKSTSLLSVNASVEAAAAGQYGKGFQIIANEVHSLAAQTLKAATNIDEISSSITKSSADFKSSIESGNITLKELSRHSLETTNSLINESNSINEMSKLTCKISESANWVNLETNKNLEDIVSINCSMNTHNREMIEVQSEYLVMEDGIETVKNSSNFLKEELSSFK